jgi:hypothetical protein
MQGLLIVGLVEARRKSFLAESIRKKLVGLIH